jgi:hypothetical protein
VSEQKSDQNTFIVKNPTHLKYSSASFAFNNSWIWILHHVAVEFVDAFNFSLA